MKLKLSAAMVTLALVTACGGGGGDDTGSVTATPDLTPVADSNRVNIPASDERTRPASGIFSTVSAPVKTNGIALFDDAGVQTVNSDRVTSSPGLRYGDFLVSNNPWNASAASYPGWFQDISLYPAAAGYGVQFDWDWGAVGDLNTANNATVFDTKSYPEVIYGTKSAGEVSGNFDETGLPVEIFDAPSITIDYAFQYEGRRSASPTSGGTDSEFNIAVESFYHDSCDIRRNGDSNDNTVFEAMVWLKLDERTPSGQAPRGVVPTSDGRLYDVYTKSDNNAYIAFVAQDENLSGTIMYSELLNHAQDNASQYGIYQLKSTDCLANILMGTEIWHGAGSFNLNEYTIHRTY